MLDETMALVATSRSRLQNILVLLSDDDLRSRAEKSFRDAQRTMEDWRAFVASIGHATRVAREKGAGLSPGP